MTDLTPRQTSLARQLANLVMENGGEGCTEELAARRLGVARAEITPAVIEAASIRYAAASTRAL
jgi:hypothetical protein